MIRRVIVPSVPPVILNPNRKTGVHWGRIHKARNAVKQEWVTEIRAQGVEPVTEGAAVRVTVRYLWPAKRSVMDADNAVGLSKYILDSFTLANVWGDDSQVLGVEIEQEKLDKTGRTMYPNGCTVVDVEEITGHGDSE